jgi:hypothetical protein
VHHKREGGGGREGGREGGTEIGLVTGQQGWGSGEGNKRIAPGKIKGQ